MATIVAEPFDLEFDPETTALIIIDMQRDFVYPGGFGEALGNDTSLLLAVPPTQRVLRRPRRGLLCCTRARATARPVGLPAGQTDRGGRDLDRGRRADGPHPGARREGPRHH